MGLWAFSSSLFRAPGADGDNSYITGLVHVREEPGDGHVADCLLEEHLLYGGRAHRAQCWQEQEQLPEATGLSWVPERHRRWGQKQPLYAVLRAACPISAHL